MKDGPSISALKKKLLSFSGNFSASASKSKPPSEFITS